VLTIFFLIEDLIAFLADLVFGISDFDYFKFYFLEQIGGIEPPTQPWQGRILPLNYICLLVLV
jgi:hypothetical protein